MSEKKPWFKLVLTIGVLGGGLFAVYEANQATRGVNALDAMPERTFIALTADVDALRRSPIFEAILGNDSGRSIGLGGVTDACGFDPTTRVHALAIAVPEEGDRGDFGIAAQIDATPDEIRGCAEKLAKSHGDGAKAANAGGFYVLEPDDAGKPRLAYRPNGSSAGALLVARGSWLDAMMDAATGQKPRLATSAAHAELRAALANVETSPSIIVTAVLPRSVRERVKREMDLEADNDPRAKEIMDGVLGVSSVGISVAAGGGAGAKGGGNAAIHVEMRCESDAACNEVEKLLAKKRLELSQKFTVRLLAGPLLDSFQAHANGMRLSASASAPADDLARGVGQILGFRRSPPVRPPPVAPFQTSFPLPSPSNAPNSPANAHPLPGITIPAAKGSATPR